MKTSGRSRVLFSLYVTSLILSSVWVLREYRLVTLGYEVLWAGASSVNPLYDSFLNPLVFLDCKLEGDSIVMRILRTYSQPGRENVTIFIKLQLFNGETVKMGAWKNVALGEIIQLSFPLDFNAGQVISYRVEIYLEEKLVLAEEKLLW
ncbi:MAG: hypothetical protein RMI04_08650 [Thermofilaceae archaeon]|nr:hypothetical protein [Thermofilaceae archaeon]